jgi:hypothetical protein
VLFVVSCLKKAKGKRIKAKGKRLKDKGQRSKVKGKRRFSKFGRAAHDLNFEF